MMNILITNDDGIASEGIKALERHLSKRYNVFLAAPLKEKSATSMALTISDKLRVEKISDREYIIDGFPVDCVNIGLHGNIFPEIDMVVSGINRGVNMGDDVHYSGTVGAARHAAIHGKLSFALSSGRRENDSIYEKEAEAFETIFETYKNVFNKGVVYNINFPHNFKPIPENFKLTTLGVRTSEDVYQVTPLYENISEYYLGGSDLGYKITEGSDFEAFYDGYISLSPVKLNATDMEELRYLRHRMNSEIELNKIFNK